MSQNPPQQPSVQLTRTDQYRDTYANSVQVRMSVWDFHLIFGTMHQSSPEQIELENFQGIYLSPQQAKALHSILSQNLQQYEHTFGRISLEPQPGIPVLPVPHPGDPVN